MYELLALSLFGSFCGTLLGYGVTLKVATRKATKMFNTERATNAGLKSGEVRAEKGLNVALVNDLLDEQSPLLAMILNYFPSAKEYLMKNPNSIPYLLKMASPFIEQYLGNNPNLKNDLPTVKPNFKYTI